jgi:hypothetical protein
MILSNAFMQYRDLLIGCVMLFLNNEPATWGYLTTTALNGVDASGDTLVDVYPIPEGAYELRFNVILRNPELVLDTDSLLIPSKPIIHLALALAARERGETGGTTTPEYFAVADRYLAECCCNGRKQTPRRTYL